jgi:EAL domain-containing protein (putative c-di-GMP-specific phosphodiesterase class I)
MGPDRRRAIVFEITERASSTGSGTSQRALPFADGFRIAIDDLGAGYVGCQLRRAARTWLDVPGARRAAASDQTLIGSGRFVQELGILVVAEGVERPRRLRP